VDTDEKQRKAAAQIFNCDLSTLISIHAERLAAGTEKHNITSTTAVQATLPAEQSVM
jgi:hypothetical protein